MGLILLVLSLFYGLPILVFACGHVLGGRTARNASAPDMTIVVAARNESDRIEACLEALLAQDVPCPIVVVDDHSEDDTARKVRAFGPRVTLLRLGVGEGKKAAITEAVRHIGTDWLLLTDADTIVPPGWARSMGSCMTDTCGYVVGPVWMEEHPGLLHAMIRLEWAGLMGIARGAIGVGQPTSACGSSVAFRKAAFEAVNGYQGVAHLASGDDELLMHRIADATDWSVAFCPDPSATVLAGAPATAADFLGQRIRWVSKAGHYERAWHVTMNVGIWLFFLLLLVGTLLAVALPSWQPWVAAAWGVKLVSEIALLGQSVVFYGRPVLLLAWIPSQLLHLVYVLAVSAMGVRGGFRWKSRAIHR